jgi:hypothetical protein
MTRTMAGADAKRAPSTPDASDACRLDDLSGPTRQLVGVGAVFGARFKITDIAEAMGQTVGGLLGAVREAVAAGALVATPDALEFCDQETHRVAYEATPAALRSALHRQIGELLLDHQEWAEAAGHLMNGLEAGDQVGASGLEHVAREVRTSTPEWSSELALRALELTDAGDVDRFGRAATAVENLVAAARLEEAEYLARSALGIARRALRAGGAPALDARPAVAVLRPAAGGRQRDRDVVSDPAVPGALRAPAELCLLWARLALGDRPAAGRQAAAILSGGPGRDELLAPALAALAVTTWSTAAWPTVSGWRERPSCGAIGSRPAWVAPSRGCAWRRCSPRSASWPRRGCSWTPPATRSWSVARPCGRRLPSSRWRGSIWRPAGSTTHLRRRVSPSTWPRSWALRASCRPRGPCWPRWR